MKIQKSSVKSVENAFTALEFIVEMTLEREGATLGEIAEKLSMRKTTARNLLQTMELCGYVTRRGFGFYRLGNQFGRLLMVSETVNRLRSISMPLLQDFCRKNAAPVHLSIFFNGKRHTSLYLDSSGSPQESSIINDTTENAYRRASTRLLLACSSPEEKERFFAEYGMPSADDWQAGADDLEHALAEIRKNACAVNDGNKIANIIGMAAGIFDPAERLCAALSTSMHAAQLPPERQEALLGALKQTAKVLTDLFSQESFL